MKKTAVGWLVVGGWLLAGCARVDLPPAEIERGGVTFDFAAISAQRFAHAFDPARNVLKDPPAAGRITKTTRFTLALPHTNGGVWRVSCRYRLRHEKAAGSTKYAVTPGGYWSYFIPECGGTWGVLSDTAKVPPGRGDVQVAFNCSGAGVIALDYRDFTIVDETPKCPVEGIWAAASWLDGTFAVSEGQPGMLVHGWRRTVKRPFPNANFTARLELPPGIQFADAAYADRKTLKTEMRPDGSSVTTFRVGSHVAGVLDDYAGWAFQSTIVRATRGVGPCGEGRLAFAYDDGKGETFTVKMAPLAFSITPAIHTALPKTYANGIMPGNGFANLAPETQALLAPFVSGCGVTWMATCATEETYALWRRAGIAHIVPSIWPCTDGFHICSSRDGETVPESDRYVALDADLKPTKVIGQSVCPVTVYEGSEYFRTKTVPFVRNYLKGTDGAWANWEPGGYAGKGCFCDRCCRKFAAYVKKPCAEVKETWPKCVMKGGAWHGVVQKFRSLEHAKVVAALDREVRACTGGEKSEGLIPAIAWIEMSSWWRPRNYAAEVQAIDYAGARKWMNPWGPYAAWESAFPFVDAQRKCLCQLLAAKDMRATVDRDYPPGRRPKLMGLPQGHQCTHWVTQPEWIGLALDSFFFAGFESTVEYYFPQGYDARYWKCFAEATGRAAKYEDCVLGGTRADDDVTATADALYAPCVRWPSGYLPEVKDAPLLQTLAWKKDGRLIVAVFNFWNRGTAFFDLKVKGLAGDVAVVDEKGVLRATDRRHPLYRGERLAEQGVRLVVPAARCRVFEFRSGGNRADATHLLTDAELRELYEAQREDLKRAAEAEDRRERANGPVEADYMPVI